VIVPCVFNLIGVCGFCVLNSILGGQTLAGISDEYLSRKFFLGVIISGPALTLAAGLVLWVRCAYMV
jgi:purine-cytosine permease-like protein